MAERSQYQYQPLTGPVWREPVAEKLAWIPSARQPACGLPPNRLGDFVQPSFQALYKPEGLHWIASDRYAGRALAYCLTRHAVLDPIPPANPRLLDWQPRDRYAGRQLSRALFDWSVYPQQITAAAYDPQNLEWTPQGRAPRVAVERRLIGDFSQPSYLALYDPQRLEWQAQDRYYGRTIPRPPFDWTVLQRPIVTQAFDPQTLDWLPRGIAPRVPVELRKVGDFQQPAFDALYKPAGMQWWLLDRYIGKGLVRSPFDASVFPQPVAAAFDPKTLDWYPRGSFPRGAIEIRRLGTFVQPAFGALYKPEGLQWLLTGLQPARSIRFIYCGQWVVDPALLASGTIPGVFPPESPVYFHIGLRTRRLGDPDEAPATERLGTDIAPDPHRLGESTEAASIERLGEANETPDAERLGSDSEKPPGRGLGS